MGDQGLFDDIFCLPSEVRCYLVKNRGKNMTHVRVRMINL